jgi:hypothetical protein
MRNLLQRRRVPVLRRIGADQAQDPALRAREPGGHAALRMIVVAMLAVRLGLVAKLAVRLSVVALLAVRLAGVSRFVA